MLTLPVASYFLSAEQLIINKTLQIGIKQHGRYKSDSVIALNSYNIKGEGGGDLPIFINLAC